MAHNVMMKIVKTLPESLDQVEIERHNGTQSHDLLGQHRHRLFRCLTQPTYKNLSCSRLFFHKPVQKPANALHIDEPFVSTYKSCQTKNRLTLKNYNQVPEKHTSTLDNNNKNAVTHHSKFNSI